MELEMASSAVAVDADDEKLPWDPSKGIEHAARSVCCECGDVAPLRRDTCLVCKVPACSECAAAVKEFGCRCCKGLGGGGGLAMSWSKLADIPRAQASVALQEQGWTAGMVTEASRSGLVIHTNVGVVRVPSSHRHLVKLVQPRATAPRTGPFKDPPKTVR